MPSMTECKSKFGDCFPCHGWGDLDPTKKCTKHPKDGNWLDIVANANCAVDRQRYFQVCCSTNPIGTCALGSSPIHIAGPKAQRCSDWKYFESYLDCTKQKKVEGKGWEPIPENAGCAVTKAMFVNSCCRVQGTAFNGVGIRTEYEMQQKAEAKAKAEEQERIQKEEEQRKADERERLRLQTTCKWLRFKSGMPCPPPREYNFGADNVEVPRVSPPQAFQQKFVESCCQNPPQPQSPESPSTCASIYNPAVPGTTCSSLGAGWTFDRKCYGDIKTSARDFLRNCCVGGKSCAAWTSSGKSCSQENMYDNKIMMRDPLVCPSSDFRKVCCQSEAPGPRSTIYKYECCNKLHRTLRSDAELALGNKPTSDKQAKTLSLLVTGVAFTLTLIASPYFFCKLYCQPKSIDYVLLVEEI